MPATDQVVRKYVPGPNGDGRRRDPYAVIGGDPVDGRAMASSHSQTALAEDIEGDRSSREGARRTRHRSRRRPPHTRPRSTPATRSRHEPAARAGTRTRATDSSAPTAAQKAMSVRHVAVAIRPGANERPSVAGRRGGAPISPRWPIAQTAAGHSGGRRDESGPRKAREPHLVRGPGRVRHPRDDAQAVPEPELSRSRCGGRADGEPDGRCPTEFGHLRQRTGKREGRRADGFAR